MKIILTRSVKRPIEYMESELFSMVSKTFEGKELPSPTSILANVILMRIFGVVRDRILTPHSAEVTEHMIS